MSLRGFKITNDLYFLCLLHNIGATSIERSKTLEEVANWAAMEPDKAMIKLQKLVEAKYVKAVFINEVERYLVNEDGIRKVLSIYS